MTFTYDHANAPDISAVRLLLNDVDDTTPVFQDEEIQVFLDLEGGVVKLAAAQAIDTNADNELLASKVLRTQDLQTDGAKLADSLRARAQKLRDQHEASLENEGFFEVIEAGSGYGVELAEHGVDWA